MNFFNGRHETVRLENGRSFGIPRRIYRFLAQAAISASELADIEPQILEHLENDRPGCVCILYGKEFAYTIQIECEPPPPPIVALGISLLDDPTLPEPVTGGDARSFDTWRVLVDAMLRSEGFVGLTAE